MSDPEFNDTHRSLFVLEANTLCVKLLSELRKMGIPNDLSQFTWELRPDDLDHILREINQERTNETWAVAVGAAFDPADAAARSLCEVWTPLLNAILYFAMPVEPPAHYEPPTGSHGHYVTYEHLTVRRGALSAKSR